MNAKQAADIAKVGEKDREAKSELQHQRYTQSWLKNAELIIEHSANAGLYECFIKIEINNKESSRLLKVVTKELKSKGYRVFYKNDLFKTVVISWEPSLWAHIKAYVWGTPL